MNKSTILSKGDATSQRELAISQANIDALRTAFAAALKTLAGPIKIDLTNPKAVEPTAQPEATKIEKLDAQALSTEGVIQPFSVPTSEFDKLNGFSKEQPQTAAVDINLGQPQPAEVTQPTGAVVDSKPADSYVAPTPQPTPVEATQQVVQPMEKPADLTSQSISEVTTPIQGETAPQATSGFQNPVGGFAPASASVNIFDQPSVPDTNIPPVTPTNPETVLNPTTEKAPTPSTETVVAPVEEKVKPIEPVTNNQPLPANDGNVFVAVHVLNNETIYDLSLRTGVPVELILAVNNVSDTNLTPGQIINLPKGDKQLYDYELEMYSELNQRIKKILGIGMKANTAQQGLNDIGEGKFTK